MPNRRRWFRNLAALVDSLHSVPAVDPPQCAGILETVVLKQGRNLPEGPELRPAAKHQKTLQTRMEVRVPAHHQTAPDPRGSDRRFGDFDCPVCNANNPYDETFGEGDEIRCYYCGQEFRVRVTAAGGLKLREV